MAFVSALIITATTISAYFFAASGDELFAARSEVVVEVADQLRLGDADRLIGTQIVIIKSRDVLGPAAEANGIDVDALLSKLSVGKVATSDVLRLSVVDPVPATALALVSAVTARFVEVSTNRGVTAPARELLDARIAEVTTRQNEVDQLLRAPAGGPPIDRRQLELEAQNLVQELADLRNRITGLELEATTRSRARVVTNAYVVEDPVAPQPSRSAVLGLLVGTGIAGAVWIALAQVRRKA